jgi:undecaprenyl-diphosphatase
VTAYAFQLWRREVGRPVRPLEEGLEPEAAHDVSPAPDEQRLMPHPWAGAAELLVGWVLTFGVLYVMGWTVTNHTDGTWIRSVDVGFDRWLQTFRTPSLDDFSYLWSKAGDTHMILLVSLVFCPLVLALWRRWRPVLFVVLAMFGELSLFLVTGAAVGRPRPPVEHLDGHLPTSSFPSGHIAATMCLYVSIALLVVPRVRAGWRWIFVALAVIMPTGVALSRMYRGMHHPTDVLGAGVLTACWITVLWFVLRPNADLGEGNRADAGELTERDAHRDLTESGAPPAGPHPTEAAGPHHAETADPHTVPAGSTEAVR